jgi:hypothetical protein
MGSGILATDKHSRLLQKSVNYNRKKFYSTGPAGGTKVSQDFDQIVGTLFVEIFFSRKNQSVIQKCTFCDWGPML